MRIATIIISFIVSNIAFSQQTSYEDFKRERLSQQRSFTTKHYSAFKAYKKKHRDDLQAFKKNIAKKWGYSDVNDRHAVVIYSESLNEKVIIDFANNEVSVSNTLDGDADKALQLLNNVLSQDINDIKNTQILAISSKPTKAVKNSVAESFGIEQKNVPDLLVNIQDKVVDESKVVENTVNSITQQVEELKTRLVKLPKSEQKEEKAFIQQLVVEKEKTNKHLQAIATGAKKANHVKRLKVSSSRLKRAKKYQEFVNLNAARYKLPSSLVYAIIETESSFNPLAQSPIPAFGLMQVVPTSAGVDVNQYLIKKKQPPSTNVLFEAETNVLFGSTYYNILYNRYFRSVKDPLSRMYCSVAAYNTGPGNVAKLFTKNGSMSLSSAAKSINKLSPDDILNTIKSNAHPETQNYITKILKAENYYASNQQQDE